MQNHSATYQYCFLSIAIPIILEMGFPMAMELVWYKQKVKTDSPVVSIFEVDR